MKEIIEQNKTKVSKYRHLYETGKAEFAVRTQLIEPILNKLGWLTYDPAFVIPNFRTTEKDEPDYTLKMNEEDVAYIEAKKISPNLKSHIGQLARYCTNQGIEYGILTDGMNWILFKAFEKGKKANERIIWEIDFEKDRISEIEAKFNTISYSNFSNLRELSDKLVKLDEAWENVANNPIKLKNVIIEFIKADLENSEYSYDIIDIDNFVSDKLQEYNRLFCAVDNSSDNIITQFKTKIVSATESGGKTKVTLKSFTHMGNGQFSYNNKPSLIIDVSKLSATEMVDLLEKNGLYTANKGTLHFQFRDKSGVINRRK